MDRNGVVYETYPLYLRLTALVLLVLVIVWGGLQYFLWPGLSAVGYGFAVVNELLLALIPLFFIAMWAVMRVAVTGKVKFSPLLMRISNRTLYLLFPFLLLIGKVAGIEKDRIMQSLIDLINHLVTLHLFVVPADRILLLTPHCLQESSCVHKVTTDVHNCKQCGRCQVGSLLEVSKRYGCHFVVVTGGTLARLKVKEIRPKAIVAIACERDLVSGMNDVFPIPVIGVLNERPCGPCCNTRVDMERIEEVVQGLIYGKNGEHQAASS